MSVSMWSYRPEVCDGGGCPGDCDLCDKPKNMEDEDVIIICEDDIIICNKTDLKDMMNQLDVVGGVRYD